MRVFFKSAVDLKCKLNVYTSVRVFVHVSVQVSELHVRTLELHELYFGNC